MADFDYPTRKDKMIIRRSPICRIISLILIAAIMFTIAGCSAAPPIPVISDADNQTVTEHIETENIITEEELTEFITSEIYLQEIVLAENKISELLLEEETITEVLCCKTIYVPQGHIEEFAENSQTAELFGEGLDLKSVLAKIAVGTGVIVTVVVLSKAGLPQPIASVVAAAADKSLEFAKNGAAIGSLFGGLTGAANEIDDAGILSAVVGFAAATAGLIMTAVSLVSAIPTGGVTTVTAAAGAKLVLAGISLLTAASGTVYAGYNAVKTYTATDVSEIDWDDVDWAKVGVSAAEKAIENASDGYMWGAVIGTVYGGTEGYEYYHKYNTPYTPYNDRLSQTPSEGKQGSWTGKRGESDFVLDDPIELPDGTKITKVTYKNGIPDFSQYMKAEVKIPNMTNSRSSNFRQADKVLSEYWTKIKYEDKIWTARDIEAYRKSNDFVWHEMSNMEYMQLVPSEVNETFTHFGGVAEYNAMVGNEGEMDFD